MNMQNTNIDINVPKLAENKEFSSSKVEQEVIYCNTTEVTTGGTTPKYINSKDGHSGPPTDYLTKEAMRKLKKKENRNKNRAKKRRKERIRLKQQREDQGQTQTIKVAATSSIEPPIMPSWSPQTYQAQQLSSKLTAPIFGGALQSSLVLTRPQKANLKLREFSAAPTFFDCERRSEAPNVYKHLREDEPREPSIAPNFVRGKQNSSSVLLRTQQTSWKPRNSVATPTSVKSEQRLESFKEDKSRPSIAPAFVKDEPSSSSVLLRTQQAHRKPIFAAPAVVKCEQQSENSNMYKRLREDTDAILESRAIKRSKDQHIALTDGNGNEPISSRASATSNTSKPQTDMHSSTRFTKKKNQVVIKSSRPCGEVLPEESEHIREHLVKEMVRAMEASEEMLQLRFLNSGVVDPGWFLVTAQDPISAKWIVDGWKPLTVEGITFSPVRADEMHQPIKIGFWVSTSEIDVGRLKHILALQNRALNIPTWLHVETTGEPGNWHLIFMVGKDTLQQLKLCGWILNYELVTLTVRRVKRKTMFHQGSSRARTKF